MTLIILIFSFFLGLVIGSALNALEYRVKHGMSFAKGRSQCTSCKHSLSFLDLVPLLSFIMLKGHCRYCEKTIGWHYPAIELMTGVSFVLFAVSGFVDLSNIYEEPRVVLSLLTGWAIITILIFIFLYDAKHMIIPNAASAALAVIGFFGSWLVFENPLEQVLLGGVAVFGFFAIMYFLSAGKWIGFGDVKLGVGLGFTLGLALSVMMLFWSYIIGAAVVIALLATNKKKVKERIAFGPFLVLGTLVSLFFGLDMLSWYLGLL